MKKNIIIGDLPWKYIPRRLCPKMERKLHGTIKNYKVYCWPNHYQGRYLRKTLQFPRKTVWIPLFNLL